MIKVLGNSSVLHGADIQVKIHARFVKPILDVTLLFLGLPLVLSRQTHNLFVSVGLCVLLVLVYMVVILGCHYLGASLKIGPALAAWIPLMIFVPLAVSMSQPLREWTPLDGLVTTEERIMATDSASDKPWVDGLTIGQVLEQTTARKGDADCLVFPALDFRLSYLQFSEHVDRMARGLMAMGISRDDHVAIWATNVPEWVILQFATARIGAVLVNINPAYRPFELKYVLQQSDAVALFLVRSFKKSNYFEILSDVCPELTAAEPGTLSCAQFPHLRLVVAIDPQPLAGAMTWDELLGRANEVDDPQLAARAAELNPQQPINIQYTSGTTGFPKAATLSHRNLLLNAYYSGECQRMTAEDRICIPVPFYHCFGCVLGTLMSAVYGAAMIVPAESFDSTATLDAIERERATVLYGVPTMFIAELEDDTFSQRDLTLVANGDHGRQPLSRRDHAASDRSHGRQVKSRSATARRKPRRLLRKHGRMIRWNCAWKR